jgi:hypothetical protein
MLLEDHVSEEWSVLLRGVTDPLIEVELLIS